MPQRLSKCSAAAWDFWKRGIVKASLASAHPKPHAGSLLPAEQFQKSRAVPAAPRTPISAVTQLRFRTATRTPKFRGSEFPNRVSWARNSRELRNSVTATASLFPRSSKRSRPASEPIKNLPINPPRRFLPRISRLPELRFQTTNHLFFNISSTPRQLPVKR